MPTTYNGIGTHYYGKRNLQTRQGTCQFCQRNAVLKSYDTRLWFVVVFIPVIPLGRKHILDQCPLCTRHRVMPQAQWEKLKGKNISDAMAAMQHSPNDPAAAIKLHSSLVAFGQIAEAEKLGRLMQERFAADAKTLAYLGSSMEFLGRPVEAVPFYQQALSLNPELPEARVAVALDLIRKGQVDEAHKLLKFLEAPGKTEYPGALFSLASAHQRAGRHKEALALFDLLTGRFPALAQDKKFRQAVKSSETAAGRGKSLLPPRKIRWKPIIASAAVIAVILAAALGANLYIERHQTLYLVSGAPKPVSVEIAGYPKETIRAGGTSSIELPEGSYHASLTGAVNEQVDIQIKSTFWDRWFRKPVFILNAGGSAILLFENTTYSSNPVGGSGSFSFYFGKPFVVLPDVDYPFQDFPASITVDSSSSSGVQKTRIALFEGPPEGAFLALIGKSRNQDAFPLAEWWLSSHHEEADLLTYYIHFSKLAHREPACREFLAEGAKRRPIEIAWHRAWQEMRSYGDEAAPLIAEYDSLLKADPDNSALLYLRGRLCSSTRESTPLYEKAIALDARNAFAHFALGMNLLSLGDSAKASPHLTEAVRLQPANAQFLQVMFDSQLAEKKYVEAETSLRTMHAKNPTDFYATLRLGQLFVLQNKSNELENLTTTYRRDLRAADEDQADETMADLNTLWFYAAGRFEDMQKMSRPSGSRSAPGNFQALVELGKLQEASGLLRAPRASAADLLALSVAWKQAGNDTQAYSCRDQAIQLLARGNIQHMAMADILQRTQPVPLDEIMDLSISSDQKALLLTAQAQRFPQGNAELLAAARQLNFTPQFPFHLINRVTAPRTGGNF